MSNFTSAWFKRDLFSNIWIVDSNTKEKFPAHGICLAANTYFEQLFSSMEKGVNTFQKDPVDGKLIIEVTNIRIAEIYVKVIYTKTYERSDINIDLSNRTQIIDLLDYGGMWFMNNNIKNTNFLYILDNLTKILETDIKLVPELYTYFRGDTEDPYYKFGNRYQRELSKFFKTHTEMLFPEMLEWICASRFDNISIKYILQTCTYPDLLYQYYKKYLKKISNKTIIEIVYAWKDFAKINQFYQLIEPALGEFVQQFVKFIFTCPSDIFQMVCTHYEQPVVSFLQYADQIRKDLNNIHTVDDLLVLDTLYPFKGMLYVYVGEVDELQGQFFCIRVSLSVRSNDTLFFNNKCYEIDKIHWGDVNVDKAYPFVYLYFKCKDCLENDLPDIGARIYKLVSLDNYMLSFY